MLLHRLICCRNNWQYSNHNFKNLLHEKTRFENLLKEDAATGKQVDDINAQIDVLKKQLAVTKQQINVQQNNMNTRKTGVL